MKKFILIKRVELIIILFFIIITILLMTYNGLHKLLQTVFNPNDEVTNSIQTIIQERSKAIVGKDFDTLKSFYDTSTRNGAWAYEFEVSKIKYILKWEQKQGINFIKISPDIVLRNIKEAEDKITANILCSTEYQYIYEDEPEEVNTFRIGTYHVVTLIKRDNDLIISKEWYNDPFSDSLKLSDIAVESVKEFITSQSIRDFSGLNERRTKAVEYANQYSGAANDPNEGFGYNKKYRNYNSRGGDCANFASQILFEGGKFRKNNSWNYDKKGATRAWLNASGFKSYMLYSGRASLIAHGSYEKVYKASYKLLPGDFVAYEKKGDITHISVVTGADTKGYSLVNCHNTDRKNVPWDLGWSGSGIKFWLVRVHY